MAKKAIDRIKQVIEPKVMEPIATPSPTIEENKNAFSSVIPTEANPGVADYYERPPQEEMGVDSDKYTLYKQQQDIANPERGIAYVYNKLANPDTYESQAEREKREKRERALSNLSGLGDGLMAIGNAFAVSQGANSAQVSSMSDANMKRRDKYDLLRKRDQQEWMANQMRVAQASEQYRLNRERMQLEREIREDNNDMRRMQNELRAMEIEAKQSRSEADYTYKMIRLEQYARDLARKEEELNAKKQYQSQLGSAANKRAGASITSANASMIRANKAENKGSGTTSSFAAPTQKKTQTIAAPAPNKEEQKRNVRSYFNSGVTYENDPDPLKLYKK